MMPRYFLQLSLYAIFSFFSPLVIAQSAHNHGSDTHAQAPIGIMGDHMHEKGEWMASYRYMFMNMDGHRSGEDSLSKEEVFHRGFSVAATEMEMHMHMFGLMYAPLDWLTLMSMFNYVEKDMKLMSNPHASSHGGHGGHGGSLHHGHSSSGFGDIQLTALFHIWGSGAHNIHGGLGLSVPTGDVDEKEDHSFLPYGMQLGSGTWDLLPSITYLGHLNPISWGSQIKGTIRLEDEGDSGFAYGDKVQLSGWLSYALSSWVSTSFRVAFESEDQIDGHYDGDHNHTSPPNFQENYGGEVVELGLGFNLLVPNGTFQGNRLAVEVLFPVHQDLNGVGMDRDISVVAGWQLAWG